MSLMTRRSAFKRDRGARLSGAVRMRKCCGWVSQTQPQPRSTARLKPRLRLLHLPLLEECDHFFRVVMIAFLEFSGVLRGQLFTV